MATPIPLQTASKDIWEHPGSVSYVLFSGPVDSQFPFPLVSLFVLTLLDPALQNHQCQKVTASLLMSHKGIADPDA